MQKSGCILAMAIALATALHTYAQVSPPPVAEPGGNAGPARSASAPATQPATSPAVPNRGDSEQLVRAAAKDGRLAFKLSQPHELTKLLGGPAEQRSTREGDFEARVLLWPDVIATFLRPHEMRGDFALFRLELRRVEGENQTVSEVDIGQDRPLVLRSADDLDVVDGFLGLAGASLARLDLREEADRLAALNFDSRTIWPGAARLPAGFDPNQILRDGQNPGLGVRALHKQGIDGRGVHVAIIDQPLLVDHREYAGHIERYELIGTYDAAIELHGPPVTSILMGRTVGVAPAARLSFYAVPMWQSDSAPFVTALDDILDRNARVQPAERVRVVSISTGMFPRWAHAEQWHAVCERAARDGVLVLTCEQTEDFPYGPLNRSAGDPDDFASYRPGRGIGSLTGLGVPAGGRAIASHAGPDVYMYWAEGGMSWCTPYLAGVAALGFQVNPELKAAEVKQFLVRTAHKTKTGLVVNPPGFVEAVRAAP